MNGRQSRNGMSLIEEMQWRKKDCQCDRVHIVRVSFMVAMAAIETASRELTDTRQVLYSAPVWPGTGRACQPLTLPCHLPKCQLTVNGYGQTRLTNETPASRTGLSPDENSLFGSVWCNGAKSDNPPWWRNGEKLPFSLSVLPLLVRLHIDSGKQNNCPQHTEASLFGNNECSLLIDEH